LGGAGISSEEEKLMIEQLPIFDRILDFAYELNGGGIKFFSPREDTRLVKDGDFFLILGEKGRSMYDYLTNSGLAINGLTPNELLRKK